MAGVDTNVLVRWLVRDDETQTRRADALFDSMQKAGSSLFVALTVALELEWVLRSRYGYARDTFSRTLAELLETEELEFQAATALEQTLLRLEECNADFADCLHSEICAAQGHAPLLTFDSRAARLANIQLLPA